LNSRNNKLRPIWVDERDGTLKVIDQRRLPHERVVLDLRSVDDVTRAIQAMVVRGAPLIGVTGGYGMVLATRAAGGGSSAIP